MISQKHGQGTHCMYLAIWLLINWPKIPQMPQNLSAQIVWPSPKVWNFNEKRLHWASVVLGYDDVMDFWKNIQMCKYIIRVFTLNLSFAKIMCNKCEFTISRKSQIVPLGLVKCYHPVELYKQSTLKSGQNYFWSGIQIFPP